MKPRRPPASYAQHVEYGTGLWRGLPVDPTGDPAGREADQEDQQVVEPAEHSGDGNDHGRRLPVPASSANAAIPWRRGRCEWWLGGCYCGKAGRWMIGHTIYCGQHARTVVGR